MPKQTMMTVTPTALQAAEAAVRAYCGWHVAPVITETLVLDGNGRERLFLPSLMVREITGLTIDGKVLDADALTKLEWTEDGVVKSPDRIFPDKYRAVSVTLSHGFDPEDVAWIVDQIAGRVADAPKGVERVTVGQRSVTYRETAGTVSLLGTEQAVLAPYKLERGVR